ncbi:hypothetical protein [Nocardia farcinica]|uniref:hypothetical protein n=1 Tax=Nocardia farcinica TaxID=37329 RepID=UPI00245509F4|nr:hypothetical protein [Nocardia farcinica]
MTKISLSEKFPAPHFHPNGTFSIAVVHRSAEIVLAALGTTTTAPYQSTDRAADESEHATQGGDLREPAEDDL